MNLQYTHSGMACFFCLLGQDNKFYQWSEQNPLDSSMSDFKWLNEEGRVDKIKSVSWNSNMNVIEGVKVLRVSTEEGTPPQVLNFPSEPQPVNVISGYDFMVVLASDGSVWTNGYNMFGQLGIGRLEDNPDRFMKVNIPEPVTQIACGSFHVLALTVGGRIWSWGQNDDGKLGIGVLRTNEESPVLVETLSSITKISAGSHHSMALTKDSQLYAWGYNRRSSVGIPGEQDQPTPQLVLTDVVDFAAGASSSMALKKNRTIWCWGIISSRHPNYHSPTQVSLPPGLIPSFIGVTTYQYFLLDSQGSFYFWGSLDGYGSQPAKDLVRMEGDLKFKIPKNNYLRWWDWEEVFRWLFLGREDRGTLLFGIPVEIVFHFVSVAF